MFKESGAVRPRGFKARGDDAKFFKCAYNYAFLPRSVFFRAICLIARVVKLVDAGDSKSPAARRAGSIPAPGTSLKSLVFIRL